MKLTKEQLLHITNLVKIPLLDEEQQSYIEKVSVVIDYVSQLQEINTDNVKQTSQVTNLENVFREDVVLESLSQKDALRNSKHTQGGYFKIPKIID